VLYWIMAIAFVCEMVDSTLGMGYGTSLTPLLLLMGYEPLQIIPCILVSECITGVSAAIYHHKAKNVVFSKSSRDTKVAIVLSVFSFLGVCVGAIVAINIPKEALSAIISVIIISMAIIILRKRSKISRFSWKKLCIIGTIASANKGMSGGGYGPLVTSGQMISGVRAKSAIAITSFAESATCFFGVVLFYALGKGVVDWHLVPYMTIGALLSVPFAAMTLKKIPDKIAYKIVGYVVLFLGLFSLYKLIVKFL